jgi:hypothetical protein
MRYCQTSAGVLSALRSACQCEDFSILYMYHEYKSRLAEKRATLSLFRILNGEMPGKASLCSLSVSTSRWRNVAHVNKHKKAPRKRRYICVALVLHTYVICCRVNWFYISFYRLLCSFRFAVNTIRFMSYIASWVRS